MHSSIAVLSEMKSIPFNFLDAPIEWIGRIHNGSQTCEPIASLWINGVNLL